MLADERSRNLVTNFASQWLHLRNLDAITPDMRLFPDFDDNLRQAFRQETELLIDSVMREDRSVLDLLRANYTFVNERLARHYGIPNVYGSRFRRITFDKDGPGAGTPERCRPRGGLLRHGSILLVTSYATRTSPVIRGKWVLDNLLGTPPPPPPPNVPALADAPTIGAAVPMRERLAQHRANPVCASCHRQMDPVGFALENYDAVGRWRTVEAGAPIDASGTLFDGTEVNGVADLEAALLRRPELFVGTITEKLLTFANGRGVEHDDAPAVRRIVREARAQDYRFSSLVIGVVTSVPFRMRTRVMMISKKALPRRTVLRGMGATLALPLLDAMVPAMTALAQTPAAAGAPPRLRLHPDGIGHRAVDASGRGRGIDRSVAEPQPARCGEGSDHHHQQPGAEERVSRHPRDVERVLPERRQGEVDRKLRLLPRHHRRSDRRTTDWPGYAAAVARAVDGSARHGRSVRQRLRLRLPEQSVVVVADHAAAVRGPSRAWCSSVCSARAAVPPSGVRR